MNLIVSLDAEQATFGTLSLTRFAARAHLEGDEMTVDPLAFGLFGGRYQGKAGITLGGDVPAFRWNAAVTGIDMAAAAAYAGSPNAITGRLSGRIDLAGRGADATAAMKTARGTARIEIVDGVVTNLGVVRAVVAATSLNTNSMKQAASGSRDEPFSKISATLAIANGSATTDDFLFNSRDIGLAARGTVRLDGMAANLKGQVQLSEELSQQVGSSVMRVTQEKGRVTLPAIVTGSAGDFSVRIDAADLAKRAIRNEVNDQAQKALKKGLGGLLHR
jgi:uncharacterized protein involved in outer membrane biogenesis